MLRIIIKLFAVSAFLLFVNFNSFAQTQVTRIQAKLFYQNSGTFSEDIFTTSSDLWNVVFDYVYSTLVIVEAQGKHGGKQFDSPPRVEFTARYKPLNGKTITIIKTAPVWFDEKGRAKVGFWLDNVGCYPVKISAKIQGQKNIMRKTINFGCGE